MAKIIEDVIIVKITRIVKSSENADSVESLVTDEVTSTVESVVQELVGPGAVVEATVA